MMINKKNYVIACFLLGWAVVSTHHTWSEPESFVISQDAVVEKNTEKKDREKKYSELQEELMLLYEEILRLQIQKMRELANAQDSCVSALKKTVENIPHMSRQRMEKEISRMKILRESLNQIIFF